MRIVMEEQEKKARGEEEEDDDDEKKEKEATPLQSVKDCCCRLRQEWEGMMLNADIAFSTLLSSLKAQEGALMAERAHVQALKQETNAMRSSFLQQTQDQETDRFLAEQVRKNIVNQLAEVKQMQCQLASQLGNLRSSMQNLREQKLDGEMTESLILPPASVPDQHVDSEKVLYLEDKNFGKPALETEAHICDLEIPKEMTPVPGQIFKQSCLTAKTEVLSDEECTLGNGNLEPRNLQRISYHGPWGHMRCEGLGAQNTMVVSPVFVKAEAEVVPQQSTKMVESPGLIKTESCGEQMELLEANTNELDHVPFSKRLELLIKKIRARQSTKEEHHPEYELDLLKRKKGWVIERNSRLKRPWEVPIQTALQEDAPGLLEMLEEKGLVDGMVVYGGFCDDEWRNGDDPFKDLECIAKKIWGTPTGLFKQPQVIRQHASGLSSKIPTYCISCLVSLIDQAKSLRQRNWPVEWGWCRDLQAFIFVFDKHNRIVLERPEYGNATYFFELVQFLPVKWQVSRLIRVLGVTALGKTALLENRPLEVGYELTADESKVLELYGWAPSTGLGSFLNFCDRVVHDVKEDDNLEWRQKIGKCLMDGYDKGRIIPPRFLEVPTSAKAEHPILLAP